MNTNIRNILLITCVTCAVAFATSANAAILKVIPETTDLSRGQEFNVNIVVSTEDEESINAVQAIVNFPTDILEIVSANRDDSALKFWVEEPAISNADGTVRFIGGTSKGISGSALQVISIKLKASGTGTADITVSDAVVTASDGKGTNVLSTIEESSVGVGTTVVKKEPTSTAEPIIQPEKVEREATVSKNLPKKPELQIPLYPDESAWYNQIGDVIVLWELPSDIVQVSTRVSRTPDLKPGEKQTELFTGKNLGPLEGEGAWYIRVQFRNNVGWGQIAYYKVSIDTTAPLPFEIEIDNEASSNPTPAIEYETSDSLSGVAKYLISVDGENAIETSSSSMTLPPQRPGSHEVVIKAVDNAGNSVEDNLKFEILPLPTPTVDFITGKVTQGELIFASGKSVPNATVNVHIFNTKEQEVFLGTAISDSLGNWEIIIEEPLVQGSYGVSADVKDNRGASSYESESISINVRAKTILSLGFADLGWFEIFLIIILLAVSGTSVVAWRYVAATKKREAYRIVAGRDIEKLSTLLANDVNSLKEVQDGDKKIGKDTKAQIDVLMKKIATTVVKMKKYISKELQSVE